MKGLLVKDFRLMKINIKSIVLIILMAIGYNIIVGNEVASSITAMITFIFGNIAMSSIAYDEADNGFSYIMTLPFAKKTYVLEKYIYTFVATFIGGMISVLIGFVFSKNLKEAISIMLVIKVMVLLMASIVLPFYIKVGVEKARNYVFIIYGLMFALVVAIARYAKSMIVGNLLIGKLYMKIISIDYVYIVLLGLVVALIIYIISMIVSIGIMKKKEF